MRFLSVLCSTALLVALPAAAAERELDAAACELAGTWYGGSSIETPYIATFTPADPNRYTARFEFAGNLSALGFLAGTSCSGEAIRTGPHSFDVYGIAFSVWSPEAAALYGVDGKLPDLIGIHALVEFSADCQSLTQTIDYFPDYFSFNWKTMTPFETEPDVDYISLEGAPLVETYHRMPTPCCGPHQRVSPRVLSAPARGPALRKR